MKELFLASFLILFMLNPVECQPEAGVTEEQEYAELILQSYGLDQTLVNGFQYFNRFAGCRGVPYFGSVGFAEGEITIAGEVYGDVRIRYNLVSQRLELEYRSPYLGYNWMETVSDHIESFRLLGYHFLRLDLEGEGALFYQVIETGSFTCYIHWERELQPVQNDQVYTHEFTRAEPRFLVLMEEELKEVRNRGDFRSLFPEDNQKEINRLLRKNKFHIQRATPEEMVLNMMQVASVFNSSLMP